MSEQSVLSQHAIEARFARNVLTPIGQNRHDLLGTLVAELGRGCDLDDLRLLGVAELVWRRMAWTRTPVDERRVPAPALDSALAEAQYLAGPRDASATLH